MRYYTARPALGVAAQLLCIEAGGLFQQRVERFVALFSLCLAGAAAGGFPGNFQARAAGQALDRLGEIQVLVVHHEAEGVTPGAAAKAVVELFVRADTERGRFFSSWKGQRAL